MKIPVKKFVDDDTKSFQERLYLLLEHHEEETKWMIEEIKRLEKIISSMEKEIRQLDQDHWDADHWDAEEN